ncbi:hypothetical protein GCM10011487_22370 [Steroidobacter agaridevorans]|uniref:Uncharacterized protein n=2 Tax=Steroidobacter agaridevorans TaxID=2695856 RepID=A0A829YA97_9GAMM|nr:hypothetical protein GCM10011487_22370 [Steroidobacter agaridevorans]
MTFEERMVGRAIQESRAWPFDGDLTRRDEVVDPNFDPPRIVRRMGWLSCLRCTRPTFSEDVVCIRLCWACGGLGSVPVGTRLSTLPNIRWEAREP